MTMRNDQTPSGNCAEELFWGGNVRDTIQITSDGKANFILN